MPSPTKIYGFSGHIRVQYFEGDKADIAEDQPIELNDTVWSVIHNDPETTHAYAYATKDAILKGPESFEGLKLKGVEPVFFLRSFTGISERRSLDSVPGQWIQQ